jgi:hypothetical protein
MRAPSGQLGMTVMRPASSPRTACGYLAVRSPRTTLWRASFNEISSRSQAPGEGSSTVRHARSDGCTTSGQKRSPL